MKITEIDIDKPIRRKWWEPGVCINAEYDYDCQWFHKSDIDCGSYSFINS